MHAVSRTRAAAEDGRGRENERKTRQLRNARESLEPLSTTNEVRYIARSPFATLISPNPLTLGKSLWRSAHAKVSFPRTKVTGNPNEMRIRGDAAMLRHVNLHNKQVNRAIINSLTQPESDSRRQYVKVGR
ncbi:hypothetical protein ALC53_09569 [Atta colombica]|uniref:Uncharacterized protein n=1 Tax=Atta colombica TaxID=520822 RepID=A0A195B699_9HYME|nr:hypothetical protein ALC53_09569 [Atta colombica]